MQSSENKGSPDMIDEILDSLDEEESKKPSADSSNIKEEADDFEVYKAAVEQAYIDGIITPDEHKMLENLRSLLDITEEQHKILQEEAEKRYVSPRISKYRAMLEKALGDDGEVSRESEAMLAQVRQMLDITNEEHSMLMSQIAKPKEKKQDFSSYRNMLQQAWVDGIITADERAMLDMFKTNLKIPEDEALKIEEEVIATLPQRPAKTPEAVDVEAPEENKAKDDTEPTAGKKSGSHQIKYGKKKMIKKPKKLDLGPQMSDDEKEAQRWLEEGERIWAASNGTEEEAMHVIDCFNKAIHLDSNSYMAWSNKGVILKKLGKVNEAIHCYDKAIEIKPDFANAWYNRGVLLGGAGKVKDAIECFNQVLTINPENQMALRDRNALMRVMKIRGGRK